MTYYRSSVIEPALSYGARSGLYSEAEALANAALMNSREPDRSIGRYKAVPYRDGLWEVVWVSIASSARPAGSMLHTR